MKYCKYLALSLLIALILGLLCSCSPSPQNASAKTTVAVRETEDTAPKTVTIPVSQELFSSCGIYLQANYQDWGMESLTKQADNSAVLEVSADNQKAVLAAAKSQILLELEELKASGIEEIKPDTSFTAITILSSKGEYKRDLGFEKKAYLLCTAYRAVSQLGGEEETQLTFHIMDNESYEVIAENQYPEPTPVPSPSPETEEGEPTPDEEEDT